MASPVEDIKARLSATELIGRDVRLQRSGRYMKGLCPFHTEKTPSFFVFEDRGTFRCFGCGEGGDIFTYILRRDACEFPDALKLLAAEAGIELTVQRKDPVQEQTRRRTRVALENAAGFMHGLLKASPTATEARKYLIHRGLSEEIIDTFRLGYAPSNGSPITDHLRKLDTDRETLRATGLMRDEDGPPRDYFFNRLIFPIGDRRGTIVGFGARALGQTTPKYLNSRESDGFHKGQHLYAFDLASEAIRRAKSAVVVEGYMDAIAAHQFGFQNTVASMGTALTVDQGQLLASSGAQRIILALDADTAGATATRRGVDILREAGRDDGETEISFRGLIRHETRLSVDIGVVALAADEDPDSVIRSDPQRWRSLIAQPVPLADYYFQWAVTQHDMSSIGGRRRAVAALTPVIAEISEPVARAHYYERLADITKVPIDELRRNTPQPRIHDSRSRTTNPTPPVDRVEEGLLELILQAPPDSHHLVGQIDPSNVTDPALRHLLSTLLEQPNTGATASCNSALEQLDVQSQERVAAARSRISTMPPLHGATFANALQVALLRLRERRVLEELRDVAAIEDGSTAAARAKELGAQKHSIEMAIRELSVLTRTPSTRAT